MSGNSSRGPSSRVERREATRARILDGAWALARDRGLTGWAMRDLGAQVGMRAQSLYEYFGSKHDIYDAMFEQGYRDFGAHMGVGRDALPLADDPAAAARADAHRFFQFCVVDPVRFQLLLLRTIPGFEPSSASYAIAVDVLGEMHQRLAAIGVPADRADLWTAVMTGMASQQIANDPGGDRWERLLDDAVAMLLAHTGTDRSTPTTKGRTR